MSSAVRMVLLLSGPNLNLSGQREPEIYGSATLDDLVEAATDEAAALGMEVQHLHSNHEGDLVDAIQAARAETAGIVINAGALSHYSWAIHDALAAFAGPVVELHLSNPGAREAFRHESVVTPVATAVIAGLGAAGYPLAMRAMADLLAATF